jgi:FO synthase
MSGVATPEEALSLYTSAPTEALVEAASRRRSEAWGHILTFSPKVFLPVTNLCRDFCDYCSFRRSPGEEGAWTMTPEEVVTWLDRGRAAGCTEALLCLGDRPEASFPAYRRQIEGWGHASTRDYLAWVSERALERGLLPHTNAGVLSEPEMAGLRATQASLGLMLENASSRLCARGMPHHRAPDKQPEARIAMTETAGELRIPFTSGLLLGIGETPRELIDTLFTIRRLEQRHGHIQEVIVQSFRAHPATRMAHHPEPDTETLVRLIAIARLVMPPEVSVQAPPNLSPQGVLALIGAGLNDFGGVSPVTPDYINPCHPWPHLEALEELCREAGFALRPRLPVYPRYLAQGTGFLEPRVAELAGSLAARMSRLERVADLPKVHG